jgi:hypothetical protein
MGGESKRLSARQVAAGWVTGHRAGAPSEEGLTNGLSGSSGLSREFGSTELTGQTEQT